MSSYRIQTAGLRDDVVATVKESKSVPLDAPQTQIEAEKSAILAEIAAMPPKLTSIKVFAFGDQFPSSTSSRREISGFIDSKPLIEAEKPVKPLTK